MFNFNAVGADAYWRCALTTADKNIVLCFYFLYRLIESSMMERMGIVGLGSDFWVMILATELHLKRQPLK